MNLDKAPDSGRFFYGKNSYVPVICRVRQKVEKSHWLNIHAGHLTLVDSRELTRLRLVSHPPWPRLGPSMLTRLHSEYGIIRLSSKDGRPLGKLFNDELAHVGREIKIIAVAKLCE